MRGATIETSRAVLALIAVMGVGVASAGCRSAAAETKARTEVPSAQLETITVGEKELPRFLTLTGSLTANQEAEVAADVSGKVYRTYVERGTFVPRGAALAIVDSRTLSLSKREARAQMSALKAQNQLAQSDCTRANTLFHDGGISQAEFERLSAQCQATDWSKQAAEARQEMADQAFSDSVIRAPFAGVVVERLVTQGEYVHPDTKVVALSDIDTLRLELSVPESAVANIAEGRAVRFRVASFPDREFSASVQYIGPALRRATRDLIVEAVAANADHTLRPGMFATAKIEIGSYKAAVVPVSALRDEESTKRIFVVNAGQLEERVVETGDVKGDEVAVLRGVAAGDRIAKFITADVRDGVRVR
ncbi:MAG TPA: efflux RND transporter periplasmic adaptor subunit [Polyangiaceae bacterium]